MVRWKKLDLKIKMGFAFSLSPFSSAWSYFLCFQDSIISFQIHFPFRDSIFCSQTLGLLGQQNPIFALQIPFSLPWFHILNSDNSLGNKSLFSFHKSHFPFVDFIFCSQNLCGVTKSYFLFTNSIFSSQISYFELRPYFE